MKLVVVSTLIVFFIYLIFLNFFLNKEKFWVAKREENDGNFSLTKYDEVKFALEKKDQPNVERYAQDCAYTLSSSGLYKKLVIGEQDGKFKCYVNKPEASGSEGEEEEEEE
jgi:hypothetical protein